MNILHLPSIVSFLAFLALGSYVFLRNRGQRLNLFFAVGMGSLALMEFGNFMALVHIGSQGAIFWKRISLVGECLIPGAWLIFGLSFARKEPGHLFKEWKWTITGVSVISAFFMAFIPSELFVMPGNTSALLGLGGVGKVFCIFFLISSVAIVASLEHTIRQLKGEQRIRIKTFVLGLGGLFAFLIYLTSQTLLFSQINLRMIPVNSSVFIICAGVIVFSVVRRQLMDVSFYVSRFVIYNSLTMVVVGGYLIFVGLVSQVVQSFDILPGYPLEILFLFVVILFFFSLFLSDRVRWKAKMFVNRHFHRSRFDYRGEWLKFSERLSLKLNMEELISTVVTVLQDSVGVKDVFLWLGDTATGKLKIARQASSGENSQLKMDQGFINALVEKKMPFLPETPWAKGFFLENSEILERFQACLVVPLISDRQLIGIILLGKKTTGEPFLGDDIDLLRSAAAQITSAIVNARLSQDLLDAKEMEVFHRLSSFVLHDLKNLVSSLSLVVQNAGEHMSNPEFQKDAFETIGKSVKKMETLTARLSTNTATTVKPNFKEANLNELVSEAVSRMGQNGQNDKTVKVDLRDIPKVLVDRGQIEKVVENFCLNAIESIDNGGSITIKTEANRDKVILSVTDNGCGMSPDYVKNSLFKPFKSTKKKGLGIGLYQCKTIVEAHYGRIEAESQEGKGSTFRVLLPVGRAHSAERRA